MKRAAAILVCLGLALLGYGSASYASGRLPADLSAPASTTDCGVGSVTSAAPITVAGTTASVAFTVAAGCTGVELTLVSYAAPSATFSEATASQQVLYRFTTAILPAGPHVLTVEVPDCFFQADFVYGRHLPSLGPEGTTNFYSKQGRFIGAIIGGRTACSTTTTTLPATTTGPTTTTGTTTGSTTTTTGSTTTTTPGTTTTGSTTTTVPPTTAGLTTTTGPSTTTAPLTTTGATTTTGSSTTTGSTTTTTSGSFAPPPGTTPTRSTSGPFKPPKLPPPSNAAQPPVPTSNPGLPFTGADLGVVTAFALVLLASGWLLFRRADPRDGAFAGAEHVAPGAIRLSRPSVPPRSFVTPRYRVYVPGHGEFASFDEAERGLLDRRWAGAGSRFLGAEGRRRSKPER